MKQDLRTPEHYVHGAEGSLVVVVPARIAARLTDLAGLDKVRTKTRGTDIELTNVLLAIRLATLDFRCSATGTAEAAIPELAPRSLWLGTRQAANLLNISDRAVRKAIVENRLAAERVGNGYRIRREDVEHYRAARGARAA